MNNFRVFALGDGPDIRRENSLIGATLQNTLKLNMQIDFSTNSGIAVDEEGKVFVVSGGSPADADSEKNPSPLLGEILCFEDGCPADRRGDYLDFRADNVPASTTDLSDGDSDRFDHIFWQAPMDPQTGGRAAIAGLARGFLLYLNRTRSDAGRLAALPNGNTQGDNETSGPILFEQLDPSHQVAGGDDKGNSNTGDDEGGLADPVNSGNPIVNSPSGGFEFLFGRDSSHNKL